MTAAERLIEANLADLILKSGSHRRRADGMCFNEAAAYFAGEKHSDQPKCVCPVIRRFTMRLNDRIRDDETRTQFLRPLIPVVVGTRSTRAVELTRAYMAIDFAVRVAAPQWIDLSDELKAHAVALRSLAPITNEPSRKAARAVTKVLRTQANAVWRGAWAKYRAAIDASAAIDAIDAIAAIAASAAIDAIDAIAASDAIDAIAAIAASAAIVRRKLATDTRFQATRSSCLTGAADLVRAMCAVTADKDAQ